MRAQANAYQYDPLLAYALTPEDPITRTHAAAISLVRSSSRLAGRMSLGLELAEFRLLLDTYFPGAQTVYFSPIINLPSQLTFTSQTDELNELLSLLLEHRCHQDQLSYWLTHAITICCMGDDHLWQDMGLTNRQELSDLLKEYFASLFQKNTHNMRWKKFFYKQLCERAGANVCRSPSCSVCVDYQNCFGPEEDGKWE